MPKLSRRTLLNSLGLLGASYFLPSIAGGHRVARADTGSIPRRVVFFYTMQGSIKKLWTPTGPGGGGAPTETDFALGPLHQALQPYKSRLLFLDGLDMVSELGVNDPIGPLNAHIAGETHSLVADKRASSYLSGNVSIDQYIAQKINSPKPVTKEPSLQLAVTHGLTDGVSHPSYLASAQQMPFEGDPRKAFSRVFPDAAAAAGDLADRQSVLDYVRGDYASVLGKVAAVDRERLTVHADAVRDLEKRLGLGPNATCSRPDPSILDGVNAPGLGDDGFLVNLDAQLRITQATLACDLARVVTLCVDAPASLAGYQPVSLGTQQTQDLHDMIHNVQPGKPLEKNPEAMKIVARYYANFASYLAQLLDLLDAVPEPDGTTLLDHTMVVWCGQIADGGHGVKNLPWLIAGGGSAGIRTGRYVKFARKPDGKGGDVGLPHNNLFVSLANRMGVETSTFGNPGVCTGPLDGVSVEGA